MKYSAPIHRLKREAKLLSRAEAIPLHQALDRVAAREGFISWSLLAAKHAEDPVSSLYAQLCPGDLLLVGARPGQGKTRLCLQLAVEAMKSGNRAAFFTLEYTPPQVLELLRTVGVDWSHLDGLFQVDCSDALCAEHIVKSLANAPSGTLAVVDYLQLLDQKREHPDLQSQVLSLQTFARQRGLIIAFISQIARSYDPATKPWPDIEDVHLPNPLDLSLFDKTWFLHGGKLQIRAD